MATVAPPTSTTELSRWPLGVTTSLGSKPRERSKPYSRESARRRHVGLAELLFVKYISTSVHQYISTAAISTRLQRLDRLRLLPAPADREVEMRLEAHVGERRGHVRPLVQPSLLPPEPPRVQPRQRDRRAARGEVPTEVPPAKGQGRCGEIGGGMGRYGEV